jgi:CheY-like chemotaxis protein
MCHVLIIEDEWLIAEYLTEIAERAGATSVATASTEDDAVHAAQDRVPGVIFSDVNLLAGTGPAAVQRIRADRGPIPVIFITANPEACEPCGPPGIVLQKPFDSASVIAAYRRVAPD